MEVVGVSVLRHQTANRKAEPERHGGRLPEQRARVRRKVLVVGARFVLARAIITVGVARAVDDEISHRRRICS